LRSAQIEVEFYCQKALKCQKNTHAVEQETKKEVNIMSCTITKTPGIPIVRDVAEFKFACGGTVGTVFLSGQQASEIIGMRALLLESIPGTGGNIPASYTISLVNTKGSILATSSLRSKTATEIVECNRNNAGFWPVVTDNIGISVSALDVGNTTDIYLTFVKKI